MGAAISYTTDAADETAFATQQLCHHDTMQPLYRFTESAISTGAFWLIFGQNVDIYVAHATLQFAMNYLLNCPIHSLLRDERVVF